MFRPVPIFTNIGIERRRIRLRFVNSPRQIGRSEGLVSELPAWQAVMEERRKRNPPSRRPKAVSLTEKLLALNGEEDVELQRLMSEQQQDFEPSPLEKTDRSVKERKRM
jgi:hypothetical protein